MVYCSQNCQQKDWSQHKLICRKTPIFPTEEESPSVKDILDELKNALKTADEKLEMPAVGRDMFLEALKRRNRVQDNLMDTVMDSFEELCKHAKLSSVTRSAVLQQVKELGTQFETAYASGLQNTPVDNDPFTPLQLKYDKIMDDMRLALGLDAPTAQEMYTQDTQAVSEMMGTTSILTAEILMKRKMEQKDVEPSLVEATWMRYFASFFRDASASAVQYTIRDMVRCIWGRESYSEAYIMSQADPDTLRQQHTETIAYLTQQSDANNLWSSIALKLLNTAKSIEDSQVEFRRHVYGDMQNLTPTEETAIRRGYLAVEVALSAALTLAAGYHLYTGWKSAAQIESERKNAYEGAIDSKEYFEVKKNEAEAISRAHNKTVEDAIAKATSCSQNLNALQTRQLIQRDTLSIGFDKQLRKMAAEELNIGVTQPQYYNPTHLIGVANATDMILRQNKYAKEGIDMWANDHLELDTNPVSVAEGAVRLQDNIRTIDQVPPEDIINWTNSTGSLIANIALKNVIDKRENPNVEGLPIRDAKFAIRVTYAEQNKIEALLEAFLERLSEVQDECAQESGLLLERSIEILHALTSMNPEVEQSVLADYLARRDSKIEATRKECSQLDADVKAAELQAQPFTTEFLRATLAYQHARKTLVLAQQANDKVQEEIARTPTDPVNYAAHSVFRGSVDIWYWLKHFVQVKFYGEQIAQHLNNHPGVTWATAFLPSVKDAWTAIQGILQIATGQWTREVFLNLLAFATKLWVLMCLLNLILLILSVVGPTLLWGFNAFLRTLKHCFGIRASSLNEEVLDRSTIHRSASNRAASWKLGSILLHLGIRAPVWLGGISILSVGNTIRVIGGIGSRVVTAVSFAGLLLTDVFSVVMAFRTVTPASALVLPSMPPVLTRLIDASVASANLVFHLILAVPTIEWVFQKSLPWSCLRRFVQNMGAAASLAGWIPNEVNWSLGALMAFMTISSTAWMFGSGFYKMWKGNAAIVAPTPQPPPRTVVDYTPPPKQKQPSSPRSRSRSRRGRK